MIDQQSAPASVVDPVCGTGVSPVGSVDTQEHRGTTYYFCSPGCALKFRANPDRYLKSEQSKPSVVVATKPGGQVEYTCPMHPQIVRFEPGPCPICGMALEPRHATTDESNPELVDMTRRFWISLALTMPTLLVMVSSFIPGDPLKQLLGSGPLLWLEFALATPVVLWGGWPFFQRGWTSVVNRHLNMFTLIALATGSAYF